MVDKAALMELAPWCSFKLLIEAIHHHENDFDKFSRKPSATINNLLFKRANSLIGC